MSDTKKEQWSFTKANDCVTSPEKFFCFASISFAAVSMPVCAIVLNDSIVLRQEDVNDDEMLLGESDVGHKEGRLSGSVWAQSACEFSLRSALRQLLARSTIE